ncbi:hypothetical protein K1T71_011609 [Dendrolimus kikuchii]|uniref:Uncharacterized protein n=1 Tax=Dendrolimus kikuchii TaxID=765133 RepID=A0ACC1CLL8_9NEOP|nr:hypothetical protein K1T71_011609 [Dendrolimus kikuchii]
MNTDLQHEDLLIKLRARLNEQKIKLWEPPYLQPENSISQSLQNLAETYSTELSINKETLLEALHELQLHSLDRSKANAEFKETGFATFRVKATVPGEKPRVLKVQKKLDVMGSQLMATIAGQLGVVESRLKLIVNGKVIKPTLSLEEQGVKNGAQIMALVMAETPEEVKKKDTMYMEMKATRDDATLLSEHVDDLDYDEEYMKLEDQSGKPVDLPRAEKRALLVGLALHERGKAAARQKDYPLALVLLLEADRQLSECSSSILETVDNWAVLQLDISWCYLCLQNLSSASDVAARLAKAGEALKQTYGEDRQKVTALNDIEANERVLFMRLYLLQGIVAYHQNKRGEAKKLLEKAEQELNVLRVDENAVTALVELGWSKTQARSGLRATAGDVNRAHHYLEEKKAEREMHRAQRENRLLGLCVDGTPVNPQLVEGLIGMGYTRNVAIAALRNSNNHVADAVRIIQEQPELISDSDLSSSSGTPSSEDDLVVADDNLITELENMGYNIDEAKTALVLARNRITGALDMLVVGGEHMDVDDPDNPSTSSGVANKEKQKKHKDKKRKEKELALNRLSSAIKADEDEYMDTSLVEEEEFLAQYKSLL